jgi:hypothetical protein
VLGGGGGSAIRGVVQFRVSRGRETRNEIRP